MAFNISPREYNRRIEAAKAYYLKHRGNRLFRHDDPTHVYKMTLGQYAIEYPKHFKRESKDGNSRIDSLDVRVGEGLIRRSKYDCNKDKYAQILADHSPNAGIRKRDDVRRAYCLEKANTADRAVNKPNFKEARTKHVTHEGRALEPNNDLPKPEASRPRSKEKASSLPSKQPLSQQQMAEYYARHMDRER